MKIKINEVMRKIRFDNRQSLTLQDVVSYSDNGSTLGLHTADGKFYIVNPKKVLYHEIVPIGETTK